MLPSRPSFRTLKPPEPFERLRAQEYGSPHPRDACRPCGCATSRPRSSLRSCAHLPAATLAATAPMPLHRHLPCVPPCPPSTFGPLIPTSWRTRGSSWSSRWRQGPAQDPMACRGGAKLRGSLQTAGTSGAGRVANRRGCLSRAVSPHPCLRLLGRPLDARLASLALPALHVLLRACACLIRCLPAAPSCSGSLSVVLPPCRRPPQGPPQWLAPGAVASSGAWGAWSCLCQEVDLVAALVEQRGMPRHAALALLDTSPPFAFEVRADPPVRFAPHRIQLSPAHSFPTPSSTRKCRFGWPAAGTAPPAPTRRGWRWMTGCAPCPPASLNVSVPLLRRSEGAQSLPMRHLICFSMHHLSPLPPRPRPFLLPPQTTTGWRGATYCARRRSSGRTGRIGVASR